jgi:hypothetical protein
MTMDGSGMAIDVDWIESVEASERMMTMMRRASEASGDEKE